MSSVFSNSFCSKLVLFCLPDKTSNLNANLSALIYIQKLKSKEEAEQFLKRINQEIGSWIKEIRDIYETLEGEKESSK